MGAGASAGRADIAHGATEIAAEAANKTDLAIDVATEGVEVDSEAVAQASEIASAEIKELLAKIPAEGGDKDHAILLFSKAEEVMSIDEVRDALQIIKPLVESGKLAGESLITAIGSTMEQVSEMAPDVVTAVTGVLVELGPHLPLIGIGAATLGAMIATYSASKTDDKNLDNFLIWAASLQEWLLLVAGKIKSSSGEATKKLFEPLNERLTELIGILEVQSKRSRITKMITTSAFRAKFNDSKEAVVQLKGALKDYLDEETQQRQEAVLANVESANIETTEKLTTMDSQLTEIKALLVQQAEQQSTKSSNFDPSNEEESIYTTIQVNLGVPTDKPITFNQLCLALQTFFMEGYKLPAEQKRGLKIAVDEDDTKLVTKLQWMAFYRRWKASEKTMEEFLLQLADEAPSTLFSYVAKVRDRSKAWKMTKSVEGAKTMALSMSANMSSLMSSGKAAMKAMGSPMGVKTDAPELPGDEPAPLQTEVAEAQG